MSPEEVAESPRRPPHLYSRREVLENPSPVPREPGVYAGFFRSVPSQVPTAGCVYHQRHVLLYAGISPKAPPKAGGRPSHQTLWNRIRYHMRGNAYGSTLRLTLGCLLAEDLGIQLQRVGTGKRMTFGTGEAVLSEWMEANATVAWVVHPKPWLPEPAVISSLAVPLNLADNREHPFYRTLKGVRAAARERARERSAAARG